MPAAAAVIVESEASSLALRAVRDALDDFGLREVEVEASYPRRSADPLPWIIEITVAAPIAAFFIEVAKAAGKSAGEDAWKTFKGFVEHVRRKRREAGPEAGTVSLGIGSIEVPLADDLPETAFEQLRLVDEESAPFSGILKWDSGTEQWVDPLAGHIVCDAQSCTDPATTEQVFRYENGMTRKFWCARHSDNDGPGRTGDN